MKNKTDVKAGPRVRTGYHALPDAGSLVDSGL